MFRWPSSLAAIKRKARLLDERKRRPDALKAWKRAADLGDAESMYQVGLHYEAGAGVLQNPLEAVAWHQRAAELGFSRACARLGSIHLTGRNTEGRNSATTTLAKLFPAGLNVPPNAVEAFRWNQKAAEAGEGGSKVLLALQFASGLGVPVDYSAASQWFAAAATGGEVAGHFGLGRLYAGHQLGEPDEERAIGEFRLAAEKGHVQAKVCLAVLLSGRGDEASLAEARDLLEQAAEQDDLSAMYLLGRANALGQGKPADLSAAEMWFRRASIKGHLQSGVALSRLLVQRPAPDYVAAAEILTQAADKGDAAAQFELARLYQMGHGVRKDHDRAVLLFERAADQGVVVALESLGGIYADGLSSVVNTDAARDWFLKAADSGSVNASFLLGALAESANADSAEHIIASYSQAADQGSAAAALRLGVIYATGELVAQNYAAAAWRYQQAAESGSTIARWNLAFLYIRGLGVPKDVGKGVEVLEADALAGHLNAAKMLEALFSEGLYTTPDPTAAREWRLRAAELGDGRAAAELVFGLDPASPSADGQEHINRLTSAAEAGDPIAQSALGRIAYEGKLVPKDIPLSLHWLMKAAEHGDAFAQAWLGDVLLSGEAIPEDRGLAVEHYWRAAEGGHTGAALVLTDLALKEDQHVSPEQIAGFWQRSAEASDPLGQRMAGDFLLKGFGSPQDVDRGLAYLRASAGAGNLGAQLLLGQTLLNRPELKLAEDEPVGWLRQAADQGDAGAQYNLGVCFRRGLNTPPDLGQAEYWYRRAADAGETSAEIALADLLFEALPDDVQKVDEIEKLYRSADNTGRPEGAFGLGRLQEMGLVAEASIMNAIKLYASAAARGHAPSQDRLRHLANSPHS